MEKKIYKTVGFYIFILSIVSISFLIYRLVQLNMLPTLIIGLILFVLAFLGFYLLFKHKIIGNLLLAGIVAFSSLASVYVNKTNVALEEVAMPDKSKAKFMVVSLKDTKDIETLGIVSVGNVKLQDIALQKLPKYKTVTYDSFYGLGDALYDGSVDAILVSDISYELLDGDLYATFLNDTKIVKEFSIKVDSSVASIPVDVTNTAFTVYISGHDLGDASTAFSHSDVNIVMTINPNTHEILMLGIPRDCYVPIQGKKDKLTHTGLYGASCIVKTMSDFLDIPINYYVEVDFNSLIEIVDALDGVTVDSPFAFSSFGFDFVQGENELNGERALAFCRERHSFEDGDKERSRNQMRVLQAIIHKAMSPAILQNYSDLMKTLSNSFKCNMNHKEMTSFIKSQMKDVKDWNIHQIQINGTGMMANSPALGFDVYMMDPNMDMVENARVLMQKVLDGKKIEESDIAAHNDLVQSENAYVYNG